MTADPGRPGSDGHIGRVRAILGSHLLVVPGVACAIVDQGDRLLMMRHAESGRWVLPGGAIEPDEQPAAAAVREAREETGIEVRPLTIVAVDGGPEHHQRYRNGDEVSYVTTVFRCEPIGGTLEGDGDETLELRWVPRADVPALEPLAPWVASLLPHLDDDVARFEAPPTD
ncbi:NUDIX domain-containing protein [Nitriliruptor alkaliphilus]|uniref:NUDIX domain-containing protein n=1 Tax=Nitriliruptor alkaliphilus TaxID=427918 RepID=UPI000698AD69|nr:NUDIX domain-containing protein [Nitriliruptor alkaliphilus]